MKHHNIIYKPNKLKIDNSGHTIASLLLIHQQYCPVINKRVIISRRWGGWGQKKVTAGWVMQQQIMKEKYLEACS